MRNLAFGLCAVAFTIVACGGDDSIGTNEDELRKDTFDKPTPHGELRFGDAPNEAAFTSDQRFHAWTFTLTKQSRIDLQTEIETANLDTVMYVYRRDPGTTAWGEAVATNDDTAGGITSRVKKQLASGEYLVKVKASKTPMTGAFKVLAACSGSGCPAPAAACSTRTFLAMPDATGFGASCTSKIDAVLNTTPSSTSSSSVKIGSKCSLAPLERSAVDFYHQYWDDHGGWDEMAGTGDEEQELAVKTELHGAAGAVVDVDLGGDEDAMTFVFDGAGKLLHYFQHNQSPDMAWFCKDAGEAAANEPSDSCVGPAVSDEGKRAFTCR
jgi:hypothetical protein